ncbi:hypothetical protein [Rhizobium leguminosarum]
MLLTLAPETANQSLLLASNRMIGSVLYRARANPRQSASISREGAAMALWDLITIAPGRRLSEMI